MHGYALLHQMFATVPACAEFAWLFNDDETYPLQTSAIALEELDLQLGSQFYADLPYIWPSVSQSLTILTLQIRKF